jgi:DNA-binding NtrC family response regulator
MSKGSVLIVDDEAGVRFGIRRFLETSGYRVAEAASCREAELQFRTLPPDAALLDLQLPDGNGVDLVSRLKELAPEVPLVILTAYGSIETAVRAIKDGAEQFLTKPVEMKALLALLGRSLENRRDQRRRLVRSARETRDDRDPFLGESAALRELEREVRRVAASDVPVLILGETGVGKGVLARFLHESGPRAEEALVDLNCAALSRDLLDSELFGHDKGAFTGAQGPKAGLLEAAHRGTVFLDEIGDMDPLVQPKLLKALEEKKIRRLGEVRDRHVDFRLVAATHRNLEHLVEAGRFRQDLYYRINAVTITVPPLRERPEDIPLLAAHLMERSAQGQGRRDLELSREAEDALRQHTWPGNVRELKNVLERALIVSDGPLIEVRDLRFSLGGSPHPGYRERGPTLDEIEHRAIRSALTAESGNVDATARRLGVSRSGLYLKLKKYSLRA